MLLGVDSDDGEKPQQSEEGVIAPLSKILQDLSPLDFVHGLQFREQLVEETVVFHLELIQKIVPVLDPVKVTRAQEEVGSKSPRLLLDSSGPFGSKPLRKNGDLLDVFADVPDKSADHPAPGIHMFGVVDQQLMAGADDPNILIAHGVGNLFQGGTFPGVGEIDGFFLGCELLVEMAKGLYIGVAPFEFLEEAPSSG